MRYAVYFCPAAGSGLDAFGRTWLSIESVPGIAAERFGALTANVRRYGWHATLCAPFALAGSATYEDLRRIAVDIARQAGAIELPLQLDRLGAFLALRPSVDERGVKQLAEHCVLHLNALRAPGTEEAWQRRAPQLDETEMALFRDYGYPYVLDRYRFHMTLCAPVSDVEEKAVRDWLAPGLATLAPAHIDALTICREAAAGELFEEIERIPLGARNGS
ncbi:MAG TPA: DUF1045 domain-containing protein [Dyella sp.]|uniref:DUF1045 domain-containing protein n=1 Tax=Dyella sp. TaxID=1869338 RepID=UPI002CAEC6C5|nr:DUF1045 domain-containing protein [Dyella sp.]HTV86367.1 DUF1045 domain-containing protein [Dyella sp.]